MILAHPLRVPGLTKRMSHRKAELWTMWVSMVTGQRRSSEGDRRLLSTMSDRETGGVEVHEKKPSSSELSTTADEAAEAFNNALSCFPISKRDFLINLFDRKY